MDVRDNLLYACKSYGFIMHKLRAYRLCIVSMILGIKDCHCFIDYDLSQLNLREYSMLWRFNF